MTTLLSGFADFDGCLLESSSFFDEELLDSNGNFEEEILEEEIDPGEVLDTIDEDESVWNCHQFEDQEDGNVAELPVDEPELDIPTIEEVQEEGQISPASTSQFTWVGSVESWIEGHELQCSNFVPGAGQVSSAEFPNSCCFSLLNNSELSVDVEKDLSADRLALIIRNFYTSSTVGFLPESYSRVLIPLIVDGLLQLRGRMGTVIHVPNALPPFLLEIRFNFSKAEASPLSDEVIGAIRQLRAWLRHPKGRFIEPMLPPDVTALRKRLRLKGAATSKCSTPVSKSHKRVREACSDGDEGCSTAVSPTKQKRRVGRDFQAMFGAKSLGTLSSMAKNGQSKPPSINDILETRRRARAKKQLEECRERDLPLVLNGVCEAADLEYEKVYRRYNYESCRKRCMGDQEVLGRLLWQSTLDGNGFLRERVSGSVEAFFQCRDPLSALGRLLGASRAVRDRSKEYRRCRGAKETELSFGSAGIGVLDGLAKAWRRVSSSHSEPVLSAPLSEAILELVSELDNSRINLVELRKQMAI